MTDVDWLKDREISADKVLIARQCHICGGTPQLMPEKSCITCNSTGRDVFRLSDCWWIDTSIATDAEIAGFKARHDYDDPKGGPRVYSRKI